MDLSQVLLLIIIFVVAIILVVIGVQIIFLLKDAKETLRKTDSILGDVEFISKGLVRSSSSLEHLVTGMQSGMQVVSLITNLIGSVTSSKKKG